jgi:hypothetical protein
MSTTKQDSAVFIMDDVQVIDDKQNEKGINWSKGQDPIKNGYGTSDDHGHPQKGHDVRSPHFAQPRGKKHDKNVIVPT